jgi:hypothetical protein
MAHTNCVQNSYQIHTLHTDCIQFTYQLHLDCIKITYEKSILQILHMLQLIYKQFTYETWVPRNQFSRVQILNPWTDAVRNPGRFQGFWSKFQTTWSFHWSFKNYTCQPFVMSLDVHQHSACFTAFSSSFKHPNRPLDMENRIDNS